MAVAGFIISPFFCLDLWIRNDFFVKIMPITAF